MSVPLEFATLCADCEQITVAHNGHCPVCGSVALLSLANILNRPEVKEVRFDLHPAEDVMNDVEAKKFYRPALAKKKKATRRRA